MVKLVGPPVPHLLPLLLEAPPLHFLVVQNPVFLDLGSQLLLLPVIKI